MAPRTDATAAAAIPLRSDYGRGVYRRRIHLVARGSVVRGELEDDFHHFRVELRHRGGRIEALAGQEIRVPWSHCPVAVPRLRALEGLVLEPSLLEFSKALPSREHCTHLFDLACLAACHAARQSAGGAARRTYDIALPDRVDARTRATLDRDGRRELEWLVDGLRVSEAKPALFADHRIAGAALLRLVASGLDPDLAEAALVLRRAIFIGLGRSYDFDRIARAATFAKVVGAACPTFSPGTVEHATRNLGTIRELSAGPGELFEPEA